MPADRHRPVRPTAAVKNTPQKAVESTKLLRIKAGGPALFQKAAVPLKSADWLMPERTPHAEY